MQVHKAVTISAFIGGDEVKIKMKKTVFTLNISKIQIVKRTVLNSSKLIWIIMAPTYNFRFGIENAIHLLFGLP